MTPQIRPASALPSSVSAKLERNPCTRQARSARPVGQKRTRHACASPQLASVTLRKSFQRQAHAKLSAHIAQTLHASATKAAGLAKVSMPPEIILASALLSWVSARMARSQSTHQGKSAHHAGTQRTRHVIASRRLAFASLLHSSPPQVLVPQFVLGAPNQTANVLLLRAGLERT